MRVYSYSSYKYSPVGYALGYVDYDKDVMVEDSNLKPCKDDFIRKCFEEGIIKSVYGKIPNKKEYILIVKKLECAFDNDDHEKSKKYCNFAFVFESDIEYYTFKNNYDVDKLKTDMNEFIVPDNSSESFGLKIKNKALKLFLENTLKETKLNNYDVEDLYIEVTSSANDNSKKLSGMVNYPVYRENNSTLYSTKKKQSALIIVIWIVVMIIIAVIVLKII